MCWHKCFLGCASKIWIMCSMYKKTELPPELFCSWCHRFLVAAPWFLRSLLQEVRNRKPEIKAFLFKNSHIKAEVNCCEYREFQCDQKRMSVSISIQGDVNSISISIFLYQIRDQQQYQFTTILVFSSLNAAAFTVALDFFNITYSQTALCFIIH